MNNSAYLAPRYEALFGVSDRLRVNRDIRELFRVLPLQLRPVLDFDYMSVFLSAQSSNQASWYVLDGDDQPALTLARDVPVEQAQVFWAFEHQQPAVAPQLMIGRGLQSGCALPMTAADRRLGAMFLGSEHPLKCSEEGVRFLSLVAGRVARAVEDVLSRESRCHRRPIDLNKENFALREEIDSASMFEEIVGSSDALDRVLAQVKKVAPNDATVLITGESGAGKELIARAIHNRSHRSRRAFVRVNCASIPATLIASELFGHEKGAFTGANRPHLGRFELANGGTIFLDEIGDIPAETQVALLRVLQEREFERVGGTHAISADVRVIAATNCDLKAAMNAGRFRLDLFYRLEVFPIRIPSLRERPEDILLLAEYFIDRYAGKSGKKIRNIERNTVEMVASLRLARQHSRVAERGGAGRDPVRRRNLLD
jgi:transcriptional regulator with GAF, ATPase, and Fis domain